MKNRNLNKPSCITSSTNETKSSDSGSGGNKSGGRLHLGLTKKNSAETKSPKKTTKYAENRSPTKKSTDYLSKKAAEGEESKGDMSSPGLRKYTRDIKDVAA